MGRSPLPLASRTTDVQVRMYPAPSSPTSLPGQTGDQAISASPGERPENLTWGKAVVVGIVHLSKIV